MDKRKYYSLLVDGTEADLSIYGDITSFPWAESDVSAYSLSKELEALDVEKINVHINSYGGEVAEGLAIYNALKNHKAEVHTICDGFACSIASVVFMAGDVRTMSKASLLMIHNAWTFAQGNANELRKQADDLEKITQASVNAYLENVNITEKQLKKMLDNETWLDYSEALEMGFATGVTAEEKTNGFSQSAKQRIVNLIKQCAENEPPEEEPPIETQETVSQNFEQFLKIFTN